MTRRTKASVTVLAALWACAAPVACSHSSSSTPPTATSSTTISAPQVTALQAVVASGTTDAKVPVDTKTARYAAQITELEHDRASALGAAAMLEIAEKDPARSATAAQLEIYRQKQLSQAADDLTKIQAMQSAAGAPFLVTDGGSGQVLGTIVSKSYAAQAAAYLAAGTKAAAKGTTGPSADEITAFLQQEAMVTADEGTGGHDVAGRVVAYALINDASVSSIMATDGGTP